MNYKRVFTPKLSPNTNPNTKYILKSPCEVLTIIPSVSRKLISFIKFIKHKFFPNSLKSTDLTKDATNILHKEELFSFKGKL